MSANFNCSYMYMASSTFVTWIVFLRMFWNFISSLPVKRVGSLSFLVGTISNVLVMEIPVGWTDVGSGEYILVSCAHSNTSIKSGFQNKVVKTWCLKLIRSTIDIVTILFSKVLYSETCLNLLGTCFCVQNRQESGLHRLN